MRRKAYNVVKWIFLLSFFAFYGISLYIITVALIGKAMGYTASCNSNTHSMEPTIDFTYLCFFDENYPFDDVVVGDIVSQTNPPAFKMTGPDGSVAYGYSFGNDNPDLKVSHRVISIEYDDEGKYFVTKGDNNDSQDLGRVHEEYYGGKLIWKMKYLGLPFYFFFVMHGNTIFLITTIISFSLLLLIDNERTMDAITRFLYKTKRQNEDDINTA